MISHHSAVIWSKRFRQKVWKNDFGKDQRLLGVDDRLLRSKKVKIQESKSGIGVENFWKSRSGESFSKNLKSKSGVGIVFIDS